MIVGRFSFPNKRLQPPEALFSTHGVQFIRVETHRKWRPRLHFFLIGSVPYPKVPQSDVCRKRKRRFVLLNIVLNASPLIGGHVVTT